MKHLTFWFDPVSPYAYLAFERLPQALEDLSYSVDYQPVLLGAISPAPPNIHYVQDYRYPTHGGFEAFLADLLADSQIVREHEVVEIAPRDREIRFRNGRSASYERLVSSIPLPDLIPMIQGAPKDVIEASQRLACTTVVLVNLGDEPHRIAPGDRIAQLVVVPVALAAPVVVEELPASDGRGEGGFGSTGR